MQEVNDLVKRAKNLPPLAASKLELVQTIADEYVSLNALATLIEREPTLCARILGLANSAMYSLPQPITNIEDAIIRVLGLDLTRGIVLGITMSGAIDTTQCQLFDFDRFWADALTLANLSKLIAELSPGQEDNTIAYLAGLLSSIGLLAIVHLEPERLNRMFKEQNNESIASKLKNEVGFDQQDVSYALLHQWGVPASIAEILNPVAGSNNRVGEQIILARFWKQSCNTENAVLETLLQRLSCHDIVLDAHTAQEHFLKVSESSRLMVASM